MINPERALMEGLSLQRVQQSEKRALARLQVPRLHEYLRDRADRSYPCLESDYKVRFSRLVSGIVWPNRVARPEKILREVRTMNILLIVIAIIAVVLLITGGLVQSLQFLLWVGIVLAVIAVVLFLVRSMAGKNSV